MKKVLIVANDAGGAEILAHFVLANKQYNFFVCLTGPAKKIFKNRCSGIKSISSGSFIQKHRREQPWILTGTSCSSDTERKAIATAKGYNIFCVSFLDHWVNYKQRFAGGALPDEIWVGDKFAFKLAQEQGFPKEKLKLVSNPLFKKAKALSHKKTKHKFKTLLYLSEWMFSKKELVAGWCSHQWGGSPYKRLEVFIESLKQRKDIKQLIIRLHPAERMAGYKGFLKKDYPFKVSFSGQFDIMKDIAKADEVYGSETMGLVLALLMKKQVFSFLPKQYKLSLPYKGIKRYGFK